MKLWLNVGDAAEYAGVCLDTHLHRVRTARDSSCPHWRTPVDSPQARVNRRLVLAGRQGCRSAG